MRYAVYTVDLQQRNLAKRQGLKLFNKFEIVLNIQKQLDYRC